MLLKTVLRWKEKDSLTDSHRKRTIEDSHALFCLPPDSCEIVTEDVDVTDSSLQWNSWLKMQNSCNPILTISADKSFLNDICKGYKHNKFCQKLSSLNRSMPRVHTEYGLWYLDECLIILRFNTLHKDLFHLAHDFSHQFHSPVTLLIIADWQDHCLLPWDCRSVTAITPTISH
jgi:hypothetical protein